MKIAADNNINPANSWNLALIDYFHDMSVLRDGSTNSINFQKASCTLDGCVKIYTSRVDSVDSETKRLLDSLVDRAGSGGGDEAPGAERRTRKHMKPAAKTLEEDAGELNCKQLDAEYAVDPLFKKTAAEFDEGGAQGLLLNHLALAPSGKVLFDASDVMAHGVGDGDGLETARGVVETSRLVMDDMFLKFGGQMSDLGSLDICPTFKAFRFDGTGEMDLDALAAGASDDTEPLAFSYHPDDAGGAYQQLLVDDASSDVGHDDGGGVGMDDGYDNYDPFLGGDGDAWPVPAMASGDGDGDGDGDDHGFVALAGDITVADEDADGTGALAGVDPAFSYFDAQVTRNWAGPEYWRSRPLRTARKPDADVGAGGGAGGAGGAQPAGTKRPRAAAATLDFLTGGPVDRDAVLAAPLRQNLLPKLKTGGGGPGSAAAAAALLLPEDLRIGADKMLRLFLKPGVAVRAGVSGSRKRVHETAVDRGGDAYHAADGQDDLGGQELGGYDGDDHYDYYAGYDGDDGDGGGGGGGGGDDVVAETGYPGTQTSAGDDGGVFSQSQGQLASGGYIDPDASIVMHLSQTQQTQQSQTQTHTQMGYGTQGMSGNQGALVFAKRAKRVDVKRLKDNIWQQMAMSDATSRSGHRPPAVAFSDVVQGLSAVYPEPAYKDISVAFCFICVLHLANEQGLEVTGDGMLADMTISVPRSA
ncbi:condensin complex subunit 2/barren [Entophlyctis helioformis]|nr:condensin complex subunit 2/barren [Entophlyctis helioformis]